MLELSLVLFGLSAATIGWYWAGVSEGRTSWVRLDRVLDVPEEGIRREGAILEREVFEIVATRLRAEYSWS